MSGRFFLVCVLIAISTATGSAVDGPLVQSEAGSETRPLPFYYDLYTFRGQNGTTTVVTTYAVEAGRLEAEAVGGRVRYRFSVTLVLADTALRSVSNTHDTVHVDVPRPIPDDHLLYTHVEVGAPPSRTTRHRVIMNDPAMPGIGQLYSDRFPIPDYGGTGLMLSDIALGQPDAEAGWTRGDVTLALLPTSRLPSSTFDVYYEIYNLPAGRPYSTELAVDRVARAGRDRAADDRPPVRLRFSGQSTADADGSLAEVRRVETSLPEGSYRLTVTITDLTTGEASSRSRPFEVHGDRRGATMVAALPQHGGRR